MRYREAPPPAPPDQASGLRRLFAPLRQRLVPLAANPFVPAPRALLGCLSAALVAHGRQVLVVDAASSAPAPQELAAFDLAACVEPVTAQLSYLAARGLPRSHVDTRGSAAGFIDAVLTAAPRSDVVLLHADPTDLARLLVQRAVRPLLLGADRPESIKHAYACCKLLVQRCSLMTFDLLLAARPDNRRVPHIAASLAGCADRFLGAVLHDWVAVDPFYPLAAEDPGLARVLAAQLALEEDLNPPSAPVRRGTSRPGSAPSARPVRRARSS